MAHAGGAFARRLCNFFVNDHETAEMERLQVDDAAKSFSERTLWAPKLMYFLYAGAQSAYIQFTPIFFEQTAQLSKFQIGVLQTIPCVCALVAPPLWGLVADTMHNQRCIHIFVIVVGALLMFAVQFVRAYHPMVAIITLAYAFLGPTWSLLDHAVLNYLDRVGGEYGKQRLWAAVGYGLGAYFAGLFVQAMGLVSCFYFQLIVSLASLVVLQFIPAPRPTHEDHVYTTVNTKESMHQAEQDQASTPASSIQAGFRVLCTRYDVLMLLVVIYCMAMAAGVIGNFLPLYLFNLSGGSPLIIGVSILCETTSEIPAFFYSEIIIRKLGTVHMMLMSIVAYAARITCYYVITNAWAAIPFEFLHGATFGLMWAASTQYIYAAAPKGLECTVIGILSGVHAGLGRSVGTMIGGWIYHAYGAKTMWLTTEIYVPLALVSLVLFAMVKNQKDNDNEDDNKLQTPESASEILDQVANMFSPHASSVCSIKSPHVQPSYEEMS